MGTKRCFKSSTIFCMLANFLTVCCCSEEILETVLINSKTDSDLPYPELNRGKREIIQSDESLRNLKVFDLGVEFRAVNATLDKGSSQYVIGSSEDNVPVKVTIIPVSAVPVLSLCRELQVDLGRSVADFTNCAVLNARPINVCRHCVVPFNETVNTYQQLMEASENTTKCKDVLFGKDKLQIVETLYENTQNLWNQGNCYSCYEVKNGAYDLSAVSNQTLSFFQALSNVSECFENIKLSVERTDASNATCIQCRSLYEHLSAVYNGIVQNLIDSQPTEEVCADIADAMNVTHHLWNNQFRCKVFGTSVGYGMVVLTVSLSSVPILFYLAAKILSNVETILLVLPKRRSVAQDTARMQM